MSTHFNKVPGAELHLMERRRFLKLSALTASSLALLRRPVMAGPFTRESFEHLVPADKKLSPEWVKSLFARGTPEILRGNELKFVGMPIGGIGAGQLYLGGDGRLWHWDIFNNQSIHTGSEHYAKPLIPSSPLGQHFTLTIGEKTRALDRAGFSDISFRGEYPIATVEYADAGVPLAVKLEAFSPFIPLQTDDSSLPATVLQFTVRNTSAAPVEATLRGELENGVCVNNRLHDGVLRNRIIRQPGLTTLLCSAEKSATPAPRRPDIVFEDWNKDTYEGWQVEGSAFGNGPIKKSDIPSYQGDVGGDTARVVNTHGSAPGDSAEARDQAVGKLTSREFTIERPFINFWIGGGRARGKSRLGLNLFVENKPVLLASGQDNNQMRWEHFDVRPFAGKTARFEIIDDTTGGWGNVGVGKIVFSDQINDTRPLEELPDFGTLALALRGAADLAGDDATAPFTDKLSGSLARKLSLGPGESATVTFILAWHFPNLSLGGPLRKAGRHYATRFPSAQAVAEYVSDNFDRLAAGTRLWRDTWYDSTLPFWFLDRTFLNTSILATSTCFRFADERFYGWEGVGCCEGTCGHVYNYAHATARLFPDLERRTRENVDFGLALQPDGAIHFRGEFNDIPAVDAQSGIIMRALREHQMSADAEFLKRAWPRIKRATQWLIAKDANGDGLIESNQHNTLDTDWFGPVAWLSGMYLAALVAAAEMADEAGDAPFARECRVIVEVGRKNLVGQLFDGEYFINKVDPKHLDAINSGTGCEIDQVFGQSWAFQIGLPRVLPQKETLSALKSIWRYNFTPDVGPYREAYRAGRWYAMAGEAGLLMCTFPRSDWDYDQAKGKGGLDWASGYFNECMNGFEYQAAGHMLWEGMTLEGLAVTRALHDRYGAWRRNPWNEVECGDHYARSMASYGVYLAACGFEYHGPKQHLGFAPKLSPENFKCAFTSAEGWGTFSQKSENATLKAELSLRSGSLKLKTMALEFSGPDSLRVAAGNNVLPASLSREGRRVLITFTDPVEIPAGQSLQINLG